MLFAFADLGLTWRGQTSGAFGLGVDVDLVGVDASVNDIDRHMFWGGLVLTSDFGDLTIGRPRSLIKTMIIAPNLGGFTSGELSSEGFSGAWLEGFGQVDLFDISGISFKATKGPIDFGASYSWVTSDLPGFSQQKILELAAVLKAGKVRFQAGFQRKEFLNVSTIRRSFGATYVGDRVSFGVLRSETPLNVFPTSTTIVFADYAITDALTLGAQVNQIQQGNFWTNQYGLTGEYTFSNGAFVDVGLSNAPDYKITNANASVGFRF